MCSLLPPPSYSPLRKSNLVTTAQSRQDRIEAFLKKYETALWSQGGLAVSYRRRDNQQFGPFYRLKCRQPDGRQVSVYVGTADSPHLELVIKRLATLRQPALERRQVAEAVRLLRRQLSAERRRLATQLAALGLHWHGSEVRGLRSSPLKQRAKVESSPSLSPPEPLEN